MPDTGERLQESTPKGDRADRARGRGLALGIAGALWIGAIGWVFWPSLGIMVERWLHDARYSHGVLVPLFALALLWVRRDQCPPLPARRSWWGVLLVALGALAHLAGGYLYFDLLDQASLLPVLAGVAVLLGGWPALRWAGPSIAFLVFMFPLPYRLEIALSLPLQRLATEASTYLLQTLGLPALAEGNVIVLDNVEIGVVEACNGLGMLVSFFAMATAVAMLSTRPGIDRLIVFLSAIPIALLVNIARITVTGVLHETVGSRWANVVFHDLAGWLMMPLGLGLLGLELKYLSHLFLKRKLAPAPVPPLAAPRTGRRRSSSSARSGAIDRDRTQDQPPGTEEAPQ